MFVVTVVFWGLVTCVTGQSTFTTVFSWNVLDWEFPNEELKDALLQSGEYQPENALPVGIERDLVNNRLFVSTPRWMDGTFFTGLSF